MRISSIHDLKDLVRLEILAVKLCKQTQSADDGRIRFRPTWSEQSFFDVTMT